MSGSTPRELTGKMNNSNPEVSIREDGLIEVLSDSPGTRTISVSIIDNRNSTSPNATGHCSSFQTDLLIEVLKNETTGSCGKPPALRKSLDFITLSLGKIFRQKLDPDYFYDIEDGNTGQLSVTMTTGYGDPLPSNHWIQFDSNNQVIYGLVTNETATQEEVLLVVAKDLCGQSSYDAIGVDMSIDSFDHTKDKKYELMVQFSSVPTCPVEDLKNIQGRLSTQFECFFLPSFQITSVHFIKLNTSPLEKDYESPTAHYSSDINHWLEIVLPVVIILCIIVIIVIILYVYYARKKKLYILQSEKPTFLEERSPVIFQTEVPVEDPTLNPRDPIILSHFDEIPSSEAELLEHRSLPSTPDYTPPTCEPPPSYRLPPPYTTSHQYW
ncbi:dystroglycan 1 [Magallana gigas]|uniref:dystroglycan 1 n=1 Tax=Magallana gigas TaxID=29159 RepID=UPI003341C6A1